MRYSDFTSAFKRTVTPSHPFGCHLVYACFQPSHELQG